MIYDIAHILFWLLYVWLAINVFYLLFFSVAGRIIKRPSPQFANHFNTIAVLITSHREDAVIVNTLTNAVQHDYPAEKFHVFLAADHLQPETLAQLKRLNASIYEVNFPVGSKARSLNYLLNKIPDSDYEVALVLDGDNVMQPKLLRKINDAFNQGYEVVQAHRSAKNLDTPIARLDAISEEINNHIFRNSQRAIGFSSSLIGSGMAFKFATLKRIYNKPGILDNPACDREVDFEVMKDGSEVEYLDAAFVYDEKVSSKAIFENQRRRWLESQMVHLKLFFNEHVPSKNKNYWNKLFINLIPPRILFIALFFMVFFICLLQYLLHENITGLPFIWWALLFGCYVAAMVIAIPGRMLNISTLNALLHLPSILMSYVRAGFTMKINRKEFIHTPKSFTKNSGITNIDE